MTWRARPRRCRCTARARSTGTSQEHTMDRNNLQISYEGAVARITLTQPEIRNAFSDEVIAELTAAFIEAGGRADVRAVGLAARGPAFCAGANLNWLRRVADSRRDESLPDASRLAEMLRVIHECPQPTLARVQGDVYAGGMGLVAACDIAVAVDTAGVFPFPIPPPPRGHPPRGRAGGASLLPHGRALWRGRGPAHRPGA